MIRVESLARARWIMSYSSRVRPTTSARFSMSVGGGASVLGFGRFSHSSALCRRDFGLAHGGQILIELLPVAWAELSLDARGRCRASGRGCCGPCAAIVSWRPSPRRRLPETCVRRRPTAAKSPGSRRRCATRTGPGCRSSATRLAKRVSRPMLLGGHLIDRDAVLEARAARMRRGGEKRPLGMMAAIDVGMRRAGDDRELRAKVLDELQIFRRLVVAAGLAGVKLDGQEAQAEVDGHEAAFDFGLGPAGRPRQPCQERQRQADARRRGGNDAGRIRGDACVSIGSTSMLLGSDKRFARRNFLDQRAEAVFAAPASARRSPRRSRDPRIPGRGRGRRSAASR